ERVAVAEALEVAGLGEDACRGLRTDAIDRRQQLANLVLVERGLDVGAEIADATAQEVDVLAGVLDLHAVRVAVMTADGDLGSSDEGAGALAAHLVPTVIAELSEGPGHDRKGLGRGVLVEDRGRELAVERLDVARELGESEVDGAVKLPDAVGHVLHEAVA